ncbi:molecular chaperonin small subunit [Candidatus Phytoplasma luffae]|uniref:10 kDa chaperonin n=1 Tax=Loofah witches'-broom phytoplasma TaxID=35773 RepID=A0A975FJP6_LOWBP|nr:co-chaperone GroES family protein [Candidatus Phytoplasma luffae]QTX03294.1 molecular chaperonin small subunit [Candidatus Phytoplasma luffae]
MIKPLDNYVVLKLKQKEVKSKSGILLQLSKQDKEDNIGIILNCGVEVKDINPNDEVVFKEHYATKIKIQNEEYLIVKREDIIAILV